MSVAEELIADLGMHSLNGPLLDFVSLAATFNLNSSPIFNSVILCANSQIPISSMKKLVHESGYGAPGVQNLCRAVRLFFIVVKRLDRPEAVLDMAEKIITLTARSVENPYTFLQWQKNVLSCTLHGELYAQK